MQRCLEYIYLVAPWLTHKTIIALDGDVKGNTGIEMKAEEFDKPDGKVPCGGRLSIGRCYTHILKNVFKFMNSKVP